MKTEPDDLAYPASADTCTDAGLTKREYFAAMAMQGLCTDENLSMDRIAEFAVKGADCLIEELNKEKP